VPKVDLGRHDMPVNVDGMQSHQEEVARESVCRDIVRDMVPKSYWRGKSVLVTGGSSGIGRAIGLAAAAAGAKVGLIARRPEPLDETASIIGAAGGQTATATCDVTDFEAMARTVATLEASLGHTDVAIASAGIHRESWPFHATTARDVIDSNVTGTINLIAAVLPGMLARGTGHLCGIASIAAVVGLPGNAAYCASKAAVVALLESLRLDCVPAGVGVTTACPGLVDTPMITDEDRAHGGVVSADDAAKRILRAIERGRAEVWFPWGTATAARLARGLPSTVRDHFLRKQPRLRDAGNP
jgi:short-subunit dehydrogenase